VVGNDEYYCNRLVDVCDCVISLLTHRQSLTRPTLPMPSVVALEEPVLLEFSRRPWQPCGRRAGVASQFPSTLVVLLFHACKGESTKIQLMLKRHKSTRVPSHSLKQTFYGPATNGILDCDVLLHQVRRTRRAPLNMASQSCAQHYFARNGRTRPRELTERTKQLASLKT